MKKNAPLALLERRIYDTCCRSGWELRIEGHLDFEHPNPMGSGAIPLKCMFLSGKWFSRLYAAKTADQSSPAVTIFSVRSLRLN